ncbi:DUF960 domain-containing protein [Streptococcus pluranimalium]|uniref:DUF960 domain-containing protein n=1 Tax=Streptococcus pluranimalium TaxID=82348 RepID=A0A2L0D2D6_9STRE|nr:DUF960 domain-containing protein [Streptococcus pluranimalium]AUW95993.1 hypothetical protein C0J00_02045 [Streptococcus pluranimalium]
MAFEKTSARYASFGVATSLPSELIDTFWDILDNYLKSVVPLDSILTFNLKKSNKGMTYEYHDVKRKLMIAFDYKYPFDPFFPQKLYIVDNRGRQTILLAHELNHL